MRYRREFWQQLVSEVEEGALVADVARRDRVQPRTLRWTPSWDHGGRRVRWSPRVPRIMYITNKSVVVSSASPLLPLAHGDLERDAKRRRGEREGETGKLGTRLWRCITPPSSLARHERGRRPVPEGRCERSSL